MPAERAQTTVRPRAGAFLRTLVVSALVALLSAAAGGGEATAVCVPAALLLVRAAGTRGQAWGGAAAAAFAAVLPSALGEGSLPSLPLLAVVVAASVGVLESMRARLEREQAALRATALRDPLTGLANRRAFEERLAYEVARHKRKGRTFALIALDMDGFKSVNDRFGHKAGDEILRDVAASLRGVVREEDTVARLGGDEFCLLAPETDREGAERLATRAEEAVARAAAGLEGLGASAGVAVFPEDGRDGAAVHEAADAAALYAKRRRVPPRRAA